MYTPIEHENEILNWLSKHLVETGLALLIGFMIWEGNLLLELKDGQTKNTLRIAHIDEAVNNAGAGEETLRELAAGMRRDVDVIKEKMGIWHP